MDKLKTLGILGTIFNLSGSPFVALFPMSAFGWMIYACGATLMAFYAYMRKDVKGKRDIAFLVQMVWFFGWNVSAILTRVII